MSKVYEALQHVHAKQNLVVQVRNDSSRENPTPNRADTQALPPRRMEREMARLHQGITALLPQSPKPIIQFIGARQGEGTSTVVWEYGCLMAEKMKKSVLIVDSGTKTMSQHRALGIQPMISLQELLRGEKSFNGSIPKAKGLSLYLCGLGRADHVQPHSDALGNDKENLTKIRSQFDYILIDSPPISLSDAALDFCATVDGVVLVVEAEVSRAPVVQSLKDSIVKNGGNILGVVFNKQRHYIPAPIYKWL